MYRGYAIAIALLFVGLIQVPGAFAFTPPPPEFPDTHEGSGVDFYAHKWTPRLGAATSVLDILPAGSPAAGDFNGDGWPDLFFPSSQYTDDSLNALREPRGRLYFNDGSTTTEERFIDVTDVAGLDVRGYAYAASFADYDNDGDQDLFVGGYRMARLFSNDRDGTFTETTAGLGLPQDGFVLGGAWGDVDLDGDLDLFLVQFADYDHPDDGLLGLDALPGFANTLLRNDGATFTDVTALYGFDALARRSTSAAFVDIDGDMDLDLYVTNYGEPAEAWLRTGGSFVESAAALGIADGLKATCQAWEDLDRDGDLDLFVAHENGAGAGVWLKGGGGFVDVSGLYGLNALDAGDGWGCVANDYDGDADMDLLVVHSGITGSMRQRATLLMNRMDEGLGFGFVDATPEAGDRDVAGYESLDNLATPLAQSGLTALDWNLDGAADFATTTNDGDHARLFRSIGWVVWTGTGYWLNVDLVGTDSNRDGRGALVTVKAGHLEVTRQAGAAMSWGSSPSGTLFFGLFRDREGGYKGDATPIDVTIRWPSGNVDVYANIFKPPPRWVRFTEGLGYQNDTLAPRPAFLLSAGTAGERGWYTSPSVTLGLSVSDPLRAGSAVSGVASLRYSRDGLAWTTASVSGATPLAFSGDGVHPLWVEATDAAGNRAVYLYPVRIDSTMPSGSFVTPVPGGIYAQGREVALVAGLPRAIVVAPAPLSGSPLGAAGEPIDEALGSDGNQTVRMDVADATSGISRLVIEVVRTDGQVPPGMTGDLPFGPYDWDWPVAANGPGEFRLRATLSDQAGNTVVLSQKVLVVPTTPQGLTETPSTPTPG